MVASPEPENGVPGPAQVTVLPSPIDNTTDVGVAIAVTDTAGTAAVADRACQTP
ncbi:hypothetical protein AB0383_16645 [Amycolatopsis sp. NPDC051373]|uniref:hypothetical protein n=1 Tax=Amycolatopsis sp. NPDC051373 TaxID=3155801 RepID=UPI00344DA4DD